MNADLARIYLWGCCGILILSLRSVTCFVCPLRVILLYTHLYLCMATSPIEEGNVLKVLGIYFNHKLTWNSMIDHLTTRCCQRMGALFCVREYVGKSGLVTTYKSFVRPVCEYGNVIYMGAFAVHLHKLDAVQKAAEKLLDYISILVISLQGQYHWPTLQAARFPISATTPGFLPYPYLCHTSPPSAICH